MSVKYNQDGFNEKTYKRIIDQQEKAGEGLTPDNFNLIVSNIANEYVQEDTIQQTEYLTTSNLNGINVGSMYEMIAYLKSGKTKLTYIEKEMQILSRNSELVIEIPDAYDGRNSFVLMGWNKQSTLGGADILPFNLDVQNVISYATHNNNGTSSEPYIQSITTIKNEREIKINIHNFDKLTINEGNFFSIKVLVLLWGLV